MKTALIIVDVQNDFLPGGALGVPDGDKVIEPLIEAAAEADLIVASRDWHPKNHCSFTDAGGQWPQHCVADTEGAEIHSFIADLADVIVSKATETDRDAYSAFDGTELAALLKKAGVERVLIGGLATDYCVKATTLDALRAGFQTTVLVNASAAVNVNEGDGGQAVMDMRHAGAQVVH